MKKTVGVLLLFVGMIVGFIACQKPDNDNEATNDGKNNAHSNIHGTWEGSIKQPNQPIHIIVSFEENDTLAGNISIPAQGIEEHPLTVEKEEGELMFQMEINNQILTFNGKPENDKIEGTFQQAGQELSFELERQEQTVEDEEEDEFLTVDTDEGTLHGELETPDSDGPYPVMLIIPGSGPTDRNGNTVQGENNSLKMVAETLAENGIASLRYDKRGAGKNSDAAIDEEDLRFEQFIDDAVQWLDLLNEDEAFSDIGIIGHSQGSLVGMLAAQDEPVDTFVSLAGPGSSIDEIMKEQLKEQLPDDLFEESEAILDKLKNDEQVEDVSQPLQSQFRSALQPFLSSWMQYDPAEEIKKIDVPMLIVNGTRDLQVPESEAEDLHEAREDADLVIIDKMNHVLKEAPDDREGNLETYWDSERPLAEGFMDDMLDFLDDNEFK